MKKLLILSFSLVTFNLALLPIVPNFSNSRERKALADALISDSPMEFQELLEKSVGEAKSSATWSKIWGAVVSLLSLNDVRISGIRRVLNRHVEDPSDVIIFANFVKNAVVEGRRAQRNEELAEKSKEVFALLKSPEFQAKWGVQGWVASAKKAKRAESWGLAAQWLAVLVSTLILSANIKRNLRSKTALIVGGSAWLWFKSVVTRLIRAADKAPDMDAVYNDALEELAGTPAQKTAE